MYLMVINLLLSRNSRLYYLWNSSAGFVFHSYQKFGIASSLDENVSDKWTLRKLYEGENEELK